VILNGVRMSRERFVGDPFLGAIAGGLFRAGVGALRRRFAPKPISGSIGVSAPPGSRTAPGVRILTPGAGTIPMRTGVPILDIPQAAMQAVRGAQAGMKLVSAGQRAAGFFAGGGGRRRRMNPLNPRALRRALSRAGAFEKFCRRTLVITKRVKLKKRGKR